MENLLYELSLEEKAGQLVFPFIDGRSLNDIAYVNQVKSDLLKFSFGGYIIFYSQIYQAHHYLNELQEISKTPLLINADLEMGVGAQFDGGIMLPANMAVGATNDPANAYMCGEITAKEARALGIHVTYAPVVDINNNPDNPIINVRAYGDNKDIVSKMGVEFIRGCKANGLLTTAKHFPGHGNTAVDSHINLTVLNSSYEELQQLELAPFKACIDAGVDSIMVGHIAVPSLDEPDIPASLSYKMVTGLLREKMGFDGLVVVDAMIMGGVREKYSPAEATVMAINAGCDIILMPLDYNETVSSIVEAVKDGRITEERLNQSLDRIWEAKNKVGLWDNKSVDKEYFEQTFNESVKYIDTVRKMDEDSLTLVKNNNVLPLRHNSRILNITVNEDDIPELDFWWKRELQNRNNKVQSISLGAEIDDADIENIKKLAKNASIIVSPIFTLIRPTKGHIDLNPKLYTLFKDLLAMKKIVIAVSFSNPYLLRKFQDIDAYICAYSFSNYSQEGAIKLLFGEIKAKGKLPVKLF